MSDDADKAPEAALTTPGDSERDGSLQATPPVDKAPGSFGEGDGKRKPGRPKGSKNIKAPSTPSDPEGRTKAWVQKKLTAILVAPAFAFEMVGEDWPKSHIDNAGPNLAKEIANKAERDPALKARIVAFLEGGETAGLIVAAAFYAAPLAIYFGLLPAPQRVRTVLGIPTRGELGAGPGDFGPPTPEALLQEAEEKGFKDVGDYMTAVQEAVAGVRAPQ